MLFKKEFTLEQRKKEANSIINKYPDRIPVICEKNPNDKSLPDLDKRKFLAPSDLSIGQFIYVVRARFKLPPEKALFVFVNGVIPASTETLSSLYHIHRDEDYFLYIKVVGENTFG